VVLVLKLQLKSLPEKLSALIRQIGTSELAGWKY